MSIWSRRRHERCFCCMFQEMIFIEFYFGSGNAAPRGIRKRLPGGILVITSYSLNSIF